MLIKQKCCATHLLFHTWSMSIRCRCSCFVQQCMIIIACSVRAHLLDLWKKKKQKQKNQTKPNHKLYRNQAEKLITNTIAQSNVRVINNYKRTKCHCVCAARNVNKARQRCRCFLVYWQLRGTVHCWAHQWQMPTKMNEEHSKFQQQQQQWKLEIEKKNWKKITFNENNRAHAHNFSPPFSNRILIINALMTPFKSIVITINSWKLHAIIRCESRQAATVAAQKSQWQKHAHTIQSEILKIP